MTSPVVIKSAGVGGGRSEALGGIIKLAKVIGSFFFFFGLNSVLKFKSGNKSVLVDFCYFFFLQVNCPKPHPSSRFKIFIIFLN